MTALSEWLQLMLAEIARKREDLERAREEESRREAESRRDGEPRRSTGAAAKEPASGQSGSKSESVVTSLERKSRVAARG